MPSVRARRCRSTEQATMPAAIRSAGETGQSFAIPAAHLLNIAGYRFVALDDLPALRDRLFAACTENALRGTILLAPEGINLFLAGTAESIAVFVQSLDADPRLAGIVLKKSWSLQPPFRRLK